MSDRVKFEEWAKVELFGHQVIVGRVSEASLAGGAFLRVDVPAVAEARAFTRFYGPGAVYCISPVSEEIAMAMLAHNRLEPVNRFEIPKLAHKFTSASESTGPDEGDDDPTNIHG